MKGLLRFLGYLGTALSRLVLFPVYFLSGFVPRRADLWVFGSWGGHRFADNSSAFFAYCRATIGDRVELVWISRRRGIVEQLRKEGYQAHWIASPTGMLRCLRAGIHVFDCFSKDTNFWLSRGAKKVNLWSGVPLKTFERDIDNPHNRYYRLFHGLLLERWVLGAMMPWHLDRPDLIIAMSEETKSITRRAFGLADEQVVITGFPRNDAFFSEELDPRAPEAFLRAADGGEKIFLYLPTFRDSGKPFLDLDWKQLNERLGEWNAKLFFKFHPVDRGHFDAHYEHIVELPLATDVYALLPRTHALISDYSSIIFDYMLLELPIIYFTPDHESFIASSRSLNFDPMEIAVGPVCSSFDELVAAMSEVATGSNGAVHGPRRTAVMERLHAYVDGHSNERVLAAIQDRILGGRLAQPAVPDRGDNGRSAAR